MTTTPQDPLPGLAEHERELAETALSLHLRRLTTWTHLPDERTDWALEQLLEDLGTAALTLRRLRGDAELPF